MIRVSFYILYVDCFILLKLFNTAICLLRSLIVNSEMIIITNYMLTIKIQDMMRDMFKSTIKSNITQK